MKSKEKSYGQYFTPEIVAKFMTDLINKPKSTEILEPCAGKGIFIDALRDKKYENITAIEIDKSLPNNSDFPIIYQDFLEMNFNKKFDVIIGNPPYVRWKNIPKNVQQTLKNNPHYADIFNGLSDLLYAFIYRSVELLKQNGELIFITPLFWTTTLHSKQLRKFLSENGYLEIFITFNEMRIFKEVSSNILIFKFVKSSNHIPMKVIHIDSKKKLEQRNIEKIEELIFQLNKHEYVKNDIYEGYLHPQFVNSNPWTPLPPNIEPIIQKIEHSCIINPRIIEINSNKYNLTELLEESDLEELGLIKSNLNKIRYLDKLYYQQLNKELVEYKQYLGRIHRYTRLGDVAYIGNGLVSGLDNAFKIINSDTLNQNEYKYLIKVVKAKNLDRYYIKGFTFYAFLNSIEKESDLDKLPMIKKQLLDNYNELKSRYSYNKEIPYWHWVFLRNYDLIQNSKEKIIVPCKERIDKRNYIRFALAEGDFFVTQDATAIVKKSFLKEDLRYILAILNSELILTWLKYKGLSRGGVLEFSEKPLSMIPIRLINWDNPIEIQIYNSIINHVNEIILKKDYEKINREIERKLRLLYGLNE